MTLQHEKVHLLGPWSLVNKVAFCFFSNISLSSSPMCLISMIVLCHRPLSDNQQHKRPSSPPVQPNIPRPWEAGDLVLDTLPSDDACVSTMKNSFRRENQRCSVILKMNLAKIRDVVKYLR